MKNPKNSVKTFSNRKLYSVNEWPHSYPPTGTLRYFIFNAERLNFKKVIRRIGRRVLIDEQAFFEWVDEQNK